MAETPQQNAERELKRRPSAVEGYGDLPREEAEAYGAEGDHPPLAEGSVNRGRAYGGTPDEEGVDPFDDGELHLGDGDVESSLRAEGRGSWLESEVSRSSSEGAEKRDAELRRTSQGLENEVPREGMTGAPLTEGPISPEARGEAEYGPVGSRRDPMRAAPPPAEGTRDLAASMPEEAPAGGAESIPPEMVEPQPGDWNIRPFSPSERFTEADTEQEFLRQDIFRRTNPPAVLGLIFALFGFLVGFWGVVMASLGLLFSGAGLALSRRGARLMPVAVIGIAISLAYLLGHLFRMG